MTHAIHVRADIWSTTITWTVPLSVRSVATRKIQFGIVHDSQAWSAPLQALLGKA